MMSLKIEYWFDPTGCYQAIDNIEDREKNHDKAGAFEKYSLLGIIFDTK